MIEHEHACGQSKEPQPPCNSVDENHEVCEVFPLGNSYSQYDIHGQIRILDSTTRSSAVDGTRENKWAVEPRAGE